LAQEAASYAANRTIPVNRCARAFDPAYARSPLSGDASAIAGCTAAGTRGYRAEWARLQHHSAAQRPGLSRRPIMPGSAPYYRDEIRRWMRNGRRSRAITKTHPITRPCFPGQKRHPDRG